MQCKVNQSPGCLVAADVTYYLAAYDLIILVHLLKTKYSCVSLLVNLLVHILHGVTKLNIGMHFEDP